MNEVGMMLREALDKGGYTVSGIAAECNYSPDAFHKAIEGRRRIPKDARTRLALVHPKAGLAIALEETGYVIFKPVPGDRHPLAGLQRIFKEDRDAEDALKELPVRLIDKLGADDLTPEDKQNLECASKELLDLARVIMDTVFDWEDRYKLGLMNVLIEKETAAS